MISVDQLTAPLPGDDPCGEDLSAGTSLNELETLIRGKPETQFSEAEEPNWREVRELSLTFSGRTRDLRVATSLSLALLKTENLPGFRDGLAVLRALIEKFWAQVHPKLDPGDGNDPLQRMNVLGALSTPRSTVGDTMRFLERLRGLPLTNSPQLGKVSLGVILDSRKSETRVEGVERLEPAQIEAAFRDTPMEERVTLHGVAVEALAHLQGIETALKEHVTAVQAPNFSELKGTLTGARDAIAPFLPKTEDAAAGGAEGDASTKDGSSGGGQRISGRVMSRDDVLRALEQVRSYYSQYEPASPIPLLIHRIERMVPMSFLELMTELAPDSIPQVTTIVGPQK